MLESFACWRSVRFSGVLPQREPRALQILRGCDLAGPARLVPDLAADLVQRVGSEHHDVKRVDAADGVGQSVGDRSGDPAGHVAGHQFDLFAARLAELIEERLDGLAVTAGRGPYQPPAVVIDDDGQVALTLAMRYLVDGGFILHLRQRVVGLCSGFGASR